MAIELDKKAIRAVFRIQMAKGKYDLSQSEISFYAGDHLYPALDAMVRSGELYYNSTPRTYSIATNWTLIAVEKDTRCRAVYFIASRGNREVVNSFDPFSIIPLLDRFKEWADENTIKDYVITRDAVLFDSSDDGMLAFLRFS